MSSVTELVSSLMLILVVTYSICASYFFILRNKSGEEEIRKRIMTVVFVVFLSIALSKLIHIIIIFRHGSVYFAGLLSFENSVLFTFSQIALYIGIIAIIFSFERRMEKIKRPYGTIISTILAVIYFVFDYLSLFNMENTTLEMIGKMASYIFNGAVYLLAFILAFMYLKVSFKTTGIVKRRSLSVFFGYFLLLISYFVFVLEDLFVDPQLIAVMAFIFGMIPVVFMIYGYR
jgi:hypothetical protein